MVFSAVLPLNILDHDDAVITFGEDLHAVLVRLAVIDGPGDGRVRFTCHCGWDPKGLSGSDDNTILDRQVKVNYRLLCFHQARHAETNRTKIIIGSTMIWKILEMDKWEFLTDLQDF